MMNGNDIDYSQYEKNNTLAFALASMMFDEYTHIIVRRRNPGYGIEGLGGGTPIRVIERFGDLHIKSSMLTPDGMLVITVF